MASKQIVFIISMKTKFILPLLTAAAFSVACSDDSKDEVLPKAADFAVVSDIHYFSPKLFDDVANADFDKYLASDRKLIRESPAIFENVVSNIIADKPNFLMISGDLTKDGEKISHTEVAQSLEKLVAMGIKVLVIPGNHDVNNPHSKSFTNGASASAESVTPDEFASIYNKCGYGDAVERHSKSLSYLLEPVKGLWVICIDACKYDNNTTSPETSGALTESTKKWIVEKLAEGKSKGKTVIAMMHHGIVEHFNGQAALFSEYLLDNWASDAAELASAGLEIVFTGHFHANDITKLASANLYDIETGSTVTYPCPYRLAQIDLEKKTLSLSTENVVDVKCSTFTGSFPAYAKTYVHDGVKGLAQAMLPAYFPQLTSEIVSTYNIDTYMADAFIAHYSGDETADATDLAHIAGLQKLNQTLGNAIGSVWNDLAPSDNKTLIQLGN